MNDLPFVRRMPIFIRFLSLLVVFGIWIGGYFLPLGSQPALYRYFLPSADPFPGVATNDGGMLWIVLLYSGVGAVVVLGYAGLLARSITRPLAELIRWVEALRLGHPVSWATKLLNVDALSQLSIGLRALVDQLNRRQEEAEQRISGNTQILERRSLQLQTAADIARDIASAIAGVETRAEPKRTGLLELDQILQRTIAMISERFHLYYAAVYLVDEEQHFASLRAATALGRQAPARPGIRSSKVRVGDASLVGHVTSSGLSRIVNDVSTDFLFQRDPSLPETRAEAVLPLLAGQKVIGVLDIHSQQRGAFSEEAQANEAILRIVADQLAIAIEFTRLLQELQRSSAEVRSLYERYTQENWSMQAASAVQAPWLQGALKGYQYDLVEVSPLLDSKEGNVVQSTAMLREQSEFQQGQVVRKDQVLLAPLTMYNQVIGVIGLQEDDPQREWTDEEVAILQALTNQISLALDNVRLLEETQRRTNQLRLLQEITAVATSHTDLLELLDNLAQKLRASFDLLHCSIYLFEPGQQRLRLVASASASSWPAPGVGYDAPGLNPQTALVSVRNSPTVRSVVQTRQSQVIYHAPQEADLDGLRTFVWERGAQTLALTPVFSRGEVVGLIGLEIADPNRQFTQEDLNLMDQISLQVSSAIDVARSFEQITQRAERERLVGEVTARIRETLDMQTILRTAAQQVRQALDVPEVTVRLVPPDLALGTTAPGPSETAAENDSGDKQDAQE